MKANDKSSETKMEFLDKLFTSTKVNNSKPMNTKTSKESNEQVAFMIGFFLVFLTANVLFSYTVAVLVTIIGCAVFCIRKNGLDKSIQQSIAPFKKMMIKPINPETEKIDNNYTLMDI